MLYNVVVIGKSVSWYSHLPVSLKLYLKIYFNNNIIKNVIFKTGNRKTNIGC